MNASRTHWLWRTPTPAPRPLWNQRGNTKASWRQARSSAEIPLRPRESGRNLPSRGFLSETPTRARRRRNISLSWLEPPARPHVRRSLGEGWHTARCSSRGLNARLARDCLPGGVDRHCLGRRVRLSRDGRHERVHRAGMDSRHGTAARPRPLQEFDRLHAARHAARVRNFLVGSRGLESV